jgi:hypothetical protein
MSKPQRCAEEKQLELLRWPDVGNKQGKKAGARNENQAEQQSDQPVPNKAAQEEVKTSRRAYRRDQGDWSKAGAWANDLS